MKISICIPQYNRIKYLLKNLEHISNQTYNNIEIVISDDNSGDNTIEEVRNLINNGYKYPIILSVNQKNLGYDRNLRKSLKLGTGDYLFILGNDDTLGDKECIRKLVEFLKSNNYPDVGYCNFTEYGDPEQKANRTDKTAVIGSGVSVALSYYSSFVYVAGLIFKSEIFNRFNTDKFDGSIYVQMYIAARIILEGYKLFTVNDYMVLANLTVDNQGADSYKDRLVKKWKDYNEFDGGLPQVINVIINAFIDSGIKDKDIFYKIIKRTITQSYPHWLLDYRSNKAFVHSVGLALGLYKKKIIYKYNIGFINKIKLGCWYIIMTLIGLGVPVKLFNEFKLPVYNYLKKQQIKLLSEG